MFLGEASAGSRGPTGRTAAEQVGPPAFDPAFDLADVVAGLGRLVADADVHTDDSERLMADVVACERARTLLDA